MCAGLRLELVEIFAQSNSPSLIVSLPAVNLISLVAFFFNFFFNTRAVGACFRFILFLLCLDGPGRQDARMILFYFQDNSAFVYTVGSHFSIALALISVSYDTVPAS